MHNKRVQSSELVVGSKKNTTNYELITNNSSGQTLVEVIVATVVGILVVSALTFAVIFALRNANFSKASAQATKLAQEGIERVRIGRDRNSAITVSGVRSWSGTQPIWDYEISRSGNCGNPGQCYFKFESSGTSGALTNIGSQLSSFPSSSAEKITSANQEFYRVVILSDDGMDYTTWKKVTVIVRWMDASATDVSKAHESKLVTILRKI